MELKTRPERMAPGQAYDPKCAAQRIFGTRANELSKTAYFHGLTIYSQRLEVMLSCAHKVLCTGGTHQLCRIQGPTFGALHSATTGFVAR